MALITIDSCGDHYTDPAHKWDSNNLCTVVSGGGRNSTACIRAGSNGRYVQRNLSSAIAGGVIGFAFKRADMVGDGAFLQIREGSTIHISFESLTNGSLRISGPGGVLGTSSPGLIVGGVYAYIEVKFTINDSTGAATVRVNGNAVIGPLSNQDTQNGGTATFDNLRLGTFASGSTNWDFDDFYLCDTTGGVNDDFLGDVRVQYLAPTCAGNSTQWTPSAGSNYENVDDAAPDGDTTYNSATLVNAIDLYALADLSGSPTSVFGVQIIGRVRKDDGGSHDVALKLRAGTTTDTGATQAVNDTYATLREVYDTNPDTTTAWDAADFPIEGGVELLT